MKILLATLDIKLNNKIIKELNIPQTEEDLLEIDHIEDLEEKSWEFNPDIIFISDDIESRDGKNIDPLIYQAITSLQDTFEVVYITERKGNDALVKRLFNKGFYKFVSKDKPLEIPANAEEVLKTTLKDLDIPAGAPVKEENHLDLPTFRAKTAPSLYFDESKSIVTAVWSPIPNVGANTFCRNLAFQLAKQDRKVLLIEFDWEFPKLARTTALTHSERNLKSVIRNIDKFGKELNIEDFVVNCKIAEDDLPHTHKQAKQRLKDIPLNLSVLCRDATARYEEEPIPPDERAIDRLFFECKRAGYQHIIVDLPSSPNNIYTMLTLLAADEKIAVVDDSYSTSGFFKMAIQALEAINITDEDFELVINKATPNLTAADISEFYDKTPSVSMPYCDEMCIRQLDLKIESSEEYSKPIKSFLKRYGINIDNKKEAEKKKFAFFAK